MGFTGVRGQVADRVSKPEAVLGYAPAIRFGRLRPGRRSWPYW
ncbi:MAG: hypothetical protein AVDCRST_MAG90-183 [uncultured Microvirga sp.]|uniref:Uncharacterized protein n=1 Tax=uncultured Microvirga sp. TaxID=412392 RepID=A0A6J4KIE5_9HYPH|nr:MAG: hypothetical protein AVDCRST_MAG90-183 [uncultured Microvirga sp.]